jgi:hypothetical protein
MRCRARTAVPTRSIHFRVISDGMYVLLQPGSEDGGASVALYLSAPPLT